ncbi:putative homogentisate phytyltransferase 1, chloroplastic-like isoform X1 [Capsicum annuum]|nr:putative homogentisate phytyltransferase 1, chloroplastic-like isoform X1 [Capsicum annuum]
MCPSYGKDHLVIFLTNMHHYCIPTWKLDSHQLDEPLVNISRVLTRKSENKFAELALVAVAAGVLTLGSVDPASAAKTGGRVGGQAFRSTAPRSSLPRINNSSVSLAIISTSSSYDSSSFTCVEQLAQYVSFICPSSKPYIP